MMSKGIDALLDMLLDKLVLFMVQPSIQGPISLLKEKLSQFS